MLNYAKTLEVLFGDSRDQIRHGLASCGIADSDVESRFIPITLLRDILDVAHPRLAQLHSDRLQNLYLFLIDTEADFQNLLRSACSSLASGSWRPHATGSPQFDKDDLRTIDRILENNAARRSASPPRSSAPTPPYAS